MQTKVVLTNVVLMAMVAFASATASANRSSYFDDVDSSFCKDIEIDYKRDIATCVASDADEVKKAKVGKALTAAEIRGLKFPTVNAVDVGIVPDDSSDTVYFFRRWLVNAKGYRVGVITFEGWHNTEMELAARFDIRYNLKGEPVLLSMKEI